VVGWRRGGMDKARGNIERVEKGGGRIRGRINHFGLKRIDNTN
jgi:hypothetical protein